MPKAFDADDKLAIRAALMATGLKHFERHGVRAARIDDSCREVGIAKGSLYAFFPSKEELFMAIVEEREAQHRQDISAFVATSQGDPEKRAGKLFDLILKKIETDPVLDLVLAHGETAHLVRKLGHERFEASQKSDRDFTRRLARVWSQRGSAIDAGDLVGLMTIMLTLATQRRQMPAGQYDPAVKLLRELFIGRLLGMKQVRTKT